MFTGLVEALGRVERIEPDADGGRRLTIAAPFVRELEIGESVAVSGACLTVIARIDESFAVEAGPETLRKTTFGSLAVGDPVNLERSLQLGDRLGGHLVQGHVDGVGQIVERTRSGEWETVWFEGPAALVAPMVPKGSVAIDGVSLTLVDVTRDRFSVALIPHTLAATTLGTKPVGAGVNLETDLISKYVAKWMENLKK
jgi:riboflavin synthase